MLQFLSLTKWFSSKISIIHDNISSQDDDKRRLGFGQWINSSIIHDNIRSPIHKKCHQNIYYSDIKYHMTLNIIFNVITLY